MYGEATLESSINHLKHSLARVIFASCFISIEAKRRVLYFLYSTRGYTLTYVTGSTKTVLIAQDRKFDFFTQTQSLMNALSSFTATVDQSEVVCFCWLLFQSTVASRTSGLES